MAFLLLAVVYLVCQSAITINAIPVDNDSAELIMKIEKVNEQLPGNDTEKKLWKDTARRTVFHKVKFFSNLSFHKPFESNSCAGEAEKRQQQHRGR